MVDDSHDCGPTGSVFASFFVNSVRSGAFHLHPFLKIPNFLVKTFHLIQKTARFVFEKIFFIILAALYLVMAVPARLFGFGLKKTQKNAQTSWVPPLRQSKSVQDAQREF